MRSRGPGGPATVVVPLGLLAVAAVATVGPAVQGGRTVFRADRPVTTPSPSPVAQAPPPSSTGDVAAFTLPSWLRDLPLVLALGLLVAVSVVLGLWWWRRRAGAEAEEGDATGPGRPAVPGGTGGGGGPVAARVAAARRVVLEGGDDARAAVVRAWSVLVGDEAPSGTTARRCGRELAASLPGAAAPAVAELLRLYERAAFDPRTPVTAAQRGRALALLADLGAADERALQPARDGASGASGASVRRCQ